jgi:hypothetical protein
MGNHHIGNGVWSVYAVLLYLAFVYVEYHIKVISFRVAEDPNDFFGIQPYLGIGSDRLAAADVLYAVYALASDFCPCCL